MSIRHASASWEGTFSLGRGRVKPEHADNIPLLREARFEEARGSNPEELIGAALAGCFSMALALTLERARLPPVSIRTDAHVLLERETDGYGVHRIDLVTEVRAPDADELMLKKLADETLRTCPIGKALKSVPIDVTVHLTGPKAQPSLGAP